MSETQESESASLEELIEHIQFNQERRRVTRQVYKLRRPAALAEWRALAA
jgi:hypothetical protein